MVASITVTRDRYDEAICVKCGHNPTVHTTTSCAHYYNQLTGHGEAKCDCTGWERDPKWPPPVLVEVPK